MSERAQSFINHLIELKDRDRGAIAQLKRSLSFNPGAYPRAYPYVERFVGTDRHADDPWRKALYLTAGLFAFHTLHTTNKSFAAAFGELGHARSSANIEQRFIALLGAEPESLPPLLRQAVSLLAADRLGCDYTSLLDHLAIWLNPYDTEGRDRLRQRWARDFYRTFDGDKASAKDAESNPAVTENS